MNLRDQIREEAIASYARVRGGWPIPLAGGAWWLILAYAGTKLETYNWSVAAFFTSGTIFPMALRFARIVRNPFMADKSALGSVLFPTFVSMLLFWPSAMAALGTNPELVPLILAIGMSVHWSVIGWSYGKAGLFSAHAIIRAVAVTWVWANYPDERLVAIALVVAMIYFITVAAIYVDSAAVRRKLVSA